MSGIGVDYLFEKIIEKLMENKNKEGDREISEVKDNGMRLQGQKGNNKRKSEKNLLLIINYFKCKKRGFKVGIVN